MNSKPPSKPRPKLTRSVALRELARRRGLLDEPGTFKLEHYLFDKQLAFVRDPHPFKIAVTTRRAGKTEGVAADLNDGASRDVLAATGREGGVYVYITINRKMAKRNIWPKLKMINSLHALAGTANETDLTITYPRGGVIMCLGAEDRAAIENLRGMPMVKCYLDEVQSFPEYIEELLDEVIGPSLMDHNGQLILSGTPGPIPSGYFYDLQKNTGWSHHSWSFFDNPKLPFLKKGITHQDMLDRELKRRGVGIDNPSIQREWFGNWVLDEDSLVYHWSKEKNHYDKLPDASWHYLIGLDLGFKDADAIAVLAYSESSPSTYLVEEKITRGQDISALVKQIDEICGRYTVDKIVVDAGGLGKKITEEISKRFSMPMVAAEKTRKMEYIELMNDALRTGKLMVRSGSQFSLDSVKVEWDQDKSTPERKVVSDRYHSDICDAVLYAWRESYSYTYQAKDADPEYGTRAWSDAESDKMFQTDLERLEQVKTVEDELRERYEPEMDLEGLQRLDRPRLKYQSQFDKRKKL